ncbi:phospholipid scramblase-related protein [Persicobacter psychrovividus]|uniref:RNAse n=1 Tax=Persicobacter psychrovividus TaxID=387638 RepID=A0ABN6LD91_9BACT|nr:RNAse [Persicobacter psychrovividus]
MDTTLNSVTDLNAFFVKEHVGMFKAANNYDILHPETQEILMTCREENLGIFTKIFRFTDYKRATPFNIELKDQQGRKILTIKRGISIFLSHVEVFDEKDQLIGYFKQKFFSIGGKFNLYNPQGEELCQLKGKWTSWDFRFVHGEKEFAHISKKWAGMAKELFTTADNYVLEISDQIPAQHPLRKMIIAAVMCIDMVLKE